MELIPKTFSKNGGILHNLILRKKDVALYSQSREGKGLGFEVHKIRVAKERQNKYRQSAHEYLASNREFGLYGWSYQKYENAIKKFKELSKNLEDRQYDRQKNQSNSE